MQLVYVQVIFARVMNVDRLMQAVVRIACITLRTDSIIALSLPASDILQLRRIRNYFLYALQITILATGAPAPVGQHKSNIELYARVNYLPGIRPVNGFFCHGAKLLAFIRQGRDTIVSSQRGVVNGKWSVGSEGAALFSHFSSRYSGPCSLAAWLLRW